MTDENRQFLKSIKDKLMALTPIELKAFENIAFELRFAKEQEMKKTIESL